MTPWSNENLSSCAYADPYAAPNPRDNTWPTPVQAGDDLDYFLPPPNPAERLTSVLAPRDERRLALNVALTAAGIPPMPEDRAVIDQLSALPADVNTVLQRWLHHAL
ncbi:hypothetical protein [Streptomyces phaeochromogenes]|uniref:hypothetical protein n=1 Tax=Streptomyces phaeochromogenes TaxID=1923 RepID=UPI002DD7BF9B|nr:hypothetical protein [Streptomyces phaeochromogenes]WRZ28810.1 hypothetical protein OG931_14125 [Streptomyces phaeochromogenes]WSS90485.1 hypothetical protein OG478_00995 [Streptomyces phaeochromogenes]WSW11677.1 hypothetical protein OG277_00740 [Streptomyces phaeochromogenes]WTA01285.1 hypothetical protein OHB08_02465 [Streptomyces phaeochromogenes]